MTVRFSFFFLSSSLSRSLPLSPHSFFLLLFFFLKQHEQVVTVNKITTTISAAAAVSADRPLGYKIDENCKWVEM
jgi:hypothetical protein